MGKRSRSKREQSEAKPAVGVWPAVIHELMFDRRTAAIVAVLAALTIAVFAQIARHDFISYDDPGYITSNEIVKGGLSAEGVHWAFTTLAPYYWQPLTWLTHMLDCQLWGVNAGPALFVNLLLHLASTLLLFALFQRMTGAIWRSALIAALFAVHPLHVESVAWVAERKDVLSTLFFMLTIRAWLRWIEHPSPRRYALTLLLFVLGLMSKPMLVTLPLALLILDLWPLRRLEIGKPGSRAASIALVREKLPMLVPAGIAVILTLIGQRGAMAGGEVPLALRLGNAAVSSVAYLGKMFWPSQLAVLYPYRVSIPPLQWIGAILVLAAISALAVRFARTRPWLLAGWLWYVVLLLPVIGIVQVGAQSMADRFTYVPLIGVFFAIVWTIAEFLSSGRAQRIAFAGSTVIVLLLASCAFVQAGYWRDTETLFAHALAVTKDNPLAELNLAGALRKRGRIAEANAHYAAALKASGDSPIPLAEVGGVLLQQERIDAAIEKLERAVALDPSLAIAQENLGIALLRKGRAAEALPHLEAAAGRVTPDRRAAVHHSLGSALLVAGRIEEAVQHLDESIRFDPRSAAAHNDLGSALARRDDTQGAEREYGLALRIDPGYFDARMNRAALLSRSGRNDEALVDFRRAVAAKPDSPEPHVYIALVLASMNRKAEAAAEATAALRIDPMMSNEILTRALHIEPKETNMAEFMAQMK